MVSMQHYCHPEALRPHHFWSTTMHVAWVIYDTNPSPSAEYSQHYTVKTSIYQCMIYTTLHLHLFLSWSLSSISRTTNKQFWKSQLCRAAHLDQHAVGCMVIYSITVISYSGSYCILIASSMTLLTSLTYILLFNFISTLVYALRPHCNWQENINLVGHQSTQPGV